MSKPMIKFGGGTSSIELYEDYVIIKPSVLKKFAGSSQIIPINSIITASIVKPFLKTPYLQIVTAGLVQCKNDGERGADANAVLIQIGNMGKAEKIKNYIIEKKAVPSVKEVSESVASQLEKLAHLREKGILTEQEFQSEKDRILNK